VDEPKGTPPQTAGVLIDQVEFHMSASPSRVPARSAPENDRRFAIVEALDADQVLQARRLFEDYARSLNFSLCFQGFDQELARLPGDYAPPRGRLLLGLDNGQPRGCVALRPLETGICEMKRLFVQPEARGTGLGGLLVGRVIATAIALGYERMRLDTLPRMDTAQALYRSLGFRQIGNYNGNPVPGTLFFELDLLPGTLAAS
jgi:GNAT superfamily N-acetyltransferase